MTMKTISVSEAKATLSEQIRKVGRGEEIVILDRGRPVARLVGVANQDEDSELDDLERLGLIRRGKALPKSFWKLPLADDPQATLRAAIDDEREDRA